MNKTRLQRVMKNMDAMGLGCILVSAPHSVYYLTGRFINPGERMLALMVKSSGDVRLFTNRLFAQAPSPDLPVTEFDDTDDSVAVLAEYLPSGKVGVDKFWPSHFTIRLMQSRPDITPVVGSAPVDDARMLKDAEELALMREASRLNDEALSRLIPTLSLGETELDVCDRYLRIARELGADGASFEPLVCFGKGCAEPHHASDDTRLGENQTAILDLGLAKNRMMSDMTRTVVMGRADDEMKRVYDLVLAANAAGRAAARPGVPMCEIDRAARKVIEDAGYGKYFIHRTGHGIGLEVHEPTDVSSANHLISQPGMVFSIEPGIYLPGRFGVRIEDLVALTSDGCETLNSLERELVEL